MALEFRDEPHAPEPDIDIAAAGRDTFHVGQHLRSGEIALDELPQVRLEIALPFDALARYLRLAARAAERLEPVEEMLGDEILAQITQSPLVGVGNALPRLEFGLRGGVT
ncbi:hypothetical protein [Kozakia baliensis]|uniref:hypothetical protein n=1 Tax=Kozakia baliensis TaxID=153496 RepID=UPI00087A71FB|nr:hypothetical protein [Kozakia baliensis]AOX21477.1 hypothetical protein A0U90_13290 [Kozakia baliensis]